MKNVFYLLLLLFVGANVSAQNEFLNKNNSLAPVGGINMGTPSSSPSVYTPNVFNKDKPVSASKSIIREKNADMNMKQFESPGNDLYKDKLNAKVEGDLKDLSIYRRDMDMGTFKSKSDYVMIYAKDYGEVDGDYVKGWHNDMVFDPTILLDEFYGKGRMIVLKKGRNVIAMEAMNTGLSGPNTAEFMVKDDKGAIITTSMWALDIGYKAVIVIEK